MLDFFKKIFSLPKNEILEREVKEGFLTAQDELLAETEAYLKDNHLNSFVDKIKERQANGFRIPVDYNFEIETLTRREKTATNINKTVLYFNEKYPKYRYILLNQSEALCKKYGLVNCSLNQYKGFIPDEIKSIISQFKVLEDDKIYYTNSYPERNVQHISDPSFLALKKENFFIEKTKASNPNIYFEEFPVQICARIEDVKINKRPERVYKNGQWSTENYDINYTQIIGRFNPEVRQKFLPEPIVLKPFFKYETYGFLILGSWFPSNRSA